MIKKHIQQIKQDGYNPSKDVIIADIASSEQFVTYKVGMIPTLTRARGGDAGFYITSEQRKISVDEQMRFQGMRPDTIPFRKAGLSRTNMGNALGNAMSCTVLERLLPRVLISSGLVSNKWKDPYE